MRRGFATPALSGRDRQARYRAQCVARGKSAARGKRKSLFEAGEFVAVDGEGFSEGESITLHAASSGRPYTGTPHFYALLAASDGSEISVPSGRLSAAACLDFLLDIKQRNPKAILVCFGGSYDVTQMLVYDLTRAQIVALMGSPGLGKRGVVDCEFGGYRYRLEYRARKALTVWRWKRGDRRYEERDDGSTRIINAVSVTLWDVWGFFQGSFRDVLKKWLPGHPDYEFIARMKNERAVFTRDQFDQIRSYNQAELRCLVAVMDKLRAAVQSLDLSLSRWDGAGAIASAMCKLNKVKLHKAQSPQPVFEAARAAYSGGHIEVCKIGHHRGVVHHYDVNSAYPHQFRRLPSLAGGVWRSGTGDPPQGFTLVHVIYEFMPDMPFYPLFHRSESGRIIYPQRGAGWYWRDEFDAARTFAARFGSLRFDVTGWHHMQPADPTARPFAWIETYYAERKRLIEEARRSGIPSGAEQVLKLGYNACYGKTAQQVGARIVNGKVKAPAYFQLEWAGFVTAGCRSQLMMAAMNAPDAIIGFATDGLFSTRPLNLYAPAEKELGAWEYETHAGITMVMPGVYWLHEADGSHVLHSRGFDKAQMSGVDRVLRSWKDRKSRITVGLTRLIGLGSSVTSEMLWQMRGMFVRADRELAINGDNSKRHPVMLYRERPHLGLVATTPRDHDCDLFAPADELESAMYPLDWIDRAVADDADYWRDVEDAALA